MDKRHDEAQADSKASACPKESPAERRKQGGKELRTRVDGILFSRPRGSKATLREEPKAAAAAGGKSALRTAHPAESTNVSPAKSGNNGERTRSNTRKSQNGSCAEELKVSNLELKKSNDELEQANATLTVARDFALCVVATVDQPLMVLDGNLRIRMANPAFYHTFQCSPEEVEGQFLDSLSDGSWNVPGLQSALVCLLHKGGSFADFRIDRTFPRVGVRNLIAAGCGVDHRRMVLLALQDVTQGKADRHALRSTEEHLRQSQKMEAVGRLAGGIAHDFNNLLTVVIGYSDLLGEKLHGNAPALDDLLEIKTAGERAASLTHQLLSFSRRQVLQPRVLQLNNLLAEFDKMLRSLVGEQIKVTVRCSPDLWRVKADPGEIGRAIMNLWLNARDAMPNGGVLEIETANLTVTKSDAMEPALPPGQYVTMAIRDTGVGMSAEVQTHIFEPFFTTKGTGKGTGLGLATVMGIAEQSGGVIHCKSAPGEGTIFTMYLPAVMGDADTSAGQTPDFSMGPKGSEVILVVEDEDAIRKLARVILEANGYVVLDARNGREGLSVCESHAGPIDLLVTDVMMPELNGRELAQGAFVLRPGMKVLFTSGHTDGVILKAGIEKGMIFLQKPFTAEELARTVRETLDSGT